MNTDPRKNLKSILVYSDSELLELFMAFILLVLNPLTQTMHFLPPAWHLTGAVSGGLLCAGLLLKSLHLREIALLCGLVNLTVINVIELRHNCFCLEPHTFFQNVVVAFLWWKVDKQRLTYQFRKGGSHGAS